MRSKKNKNNAWDQSALINFPPLDNPSNDDQLFPQSLIYPDSHGYDYIIHDQQHKIEDPTNDYPRSSQMDQFGIESPSQNMSNPEESSEENSIFWMPDPPLPLPDPQLISPQQPIFLTPPQIPPLKTTSKKINRKYYGYIFAEQNSSEKNSSQRLEANLLTRIIDETINQTVSDESIDSEIRDHNKILLKKKRLQKLSMLVGLVPQYPIEKQQKIYEFNRTIMQKALKDRALIKKMIIKSTKIQELDKKKQYMRQIKVYLHRLKSRMIATRTQSK